MCTTNANWLLLYFHKIPSEVPVHATDKWHYKHEWVESYRRRDMSANILKVKIYFK